MFSFNEFMSNKLFSHMVRKIYSETIIYEALLENGKTDENRTYFHLIQ